MEENKMHVRLQCSAHIVLSGLVDPVKEVSRLEKKMTALAGTADKLEKAAKVNWHLHSLLENDDSWQEVAS